MRFEKGHRLTKNVLGGSSKYWRGVLRLKSYSTAVSAGRVGGSADRFCRLYPPRWIALVIVMRNSEDLSREKDKARTLLIMKEIGN